jgi:hypothetical protein
MVLETDNKKFRERLTYGKIAWTYQANQASKFKNGIANKLPIGTEIYETGTPVFIAIVDGKEIPYLYKVEG